MVAKFVKIRHPKTKGEALVPESSVPHHLRAGWELADKPEPRKAAAAEQSDKTQGS